MDPQGDQTAQPVEPVVEGQPAGEGELMPEVPAEGAVSEGEQPAA